MAYLEGKSGLLNAPTGSGKTFALFIPVLLNWIKNHPKDYKSKKQNGLLLLWITPIRALANDLRLAMQAALEELEIPWQVAVRSGDTTTAQRNQQKKQMPEVLITTPESLHLMLSQKNYAATFKNLQALVVDEWHELLGSKRGVQVELAASRIKTMLPSIQLWGISATIGNLNEALEVLLGSNFDRQALIVKANIKKEVIIETILPDTIQKFPWAGHLGIQLLGKLKPIIEQAKTLLIFTNTRSFAEIWYQNLLAFMPELAGQIAMHHGSIGGDIRAWIEEALHAGKLKVVVCTSSLDLGVDFRPVDTVVQIGSPKGVARFMQRAGRSGHQPGAASKIYFLPTNSLEIIEASALKEAINKGFVESRQPVIRSFDVLAQYLLTLAVGDGFQPDLLLPEVLSTFAFQSMDREEWQWLLNFIKTGGESLQAYDEYAKITVEDGLWKVTNRKQAMQHRLSIGTIVSDANVAIKFMNGTHIGNVEEWFVSRLQIGDAFMFAGKTLELITIKDMAAYVRNSNKPRGVVPSYMGGRMPLSSELSAMIRLRVDDAYKKNAPDAEMELLKPLFQMQNERSHVPHQNELLIEMYEDKDGYHLFCYPFEGRLVNEGLAILMAQRLSKIVPATYSIGMNDYGFELLSDQEIPLEWALEEDLFSTDHLIDDLQQSMNSSEMAKRKFRDIAHIAGLIFKGFPNKQIRQKHMHANSKLFFDVFRDYDPDNLLLKQAYEEVLYYQLEEVRLRAALKRIRQQEITIINMEKPSPFCFPLMVDSMRGKISNEKLEDRIRKLIGKE